MVKFDDSASNSRVAELRAQEEERMVQIMAPKYGYEYISLRGYTINPEAMAVINEEKARTAGAVAFEMNNNTKLMNLDKLEHQNLDEYNVYIDTTFL